MQKRKERKETDGCERRERWRKEGKVERKRKKEGIKRSMGEDGGRRKEGRVVRQSKDGLGRLPCSCA